MAKKRVVILGSTGSIGTQALEVVRRYPDRLSVVGLCCNTDIDTLAKQIQEFKPLFVAVGSGVPTTETAITEAHTLMLLKSKSSMPSESGTKAIRSRSKQLDMPTILRPRKSS